MQALHITLMVNYSKLRLTYRLTLRILLLRFLPDPDRSLENHNLLKKRDEYIARDQILPTVTVLQFLQE